MANPLITLQGLDKPQGVQSFMTGVSQGAESARIPMQNRLLEAQTKGAEQQLTRQQAEFQLQDTATDALQIKELAQVDPMRAQVALAERIKKITDRGGDPSDTIAVRELLTAGRMDEFYAELDAPINAARQRGLLGQGGMTDYQKQSLELQRMRLAADGGDPSAVREYKYFSSLDDDAKREFLTTKRAGTYFDKGDVTMKADPLNGTAAPVQEAGKSQTQEQIQSELTAQSAVKAASEKAATTAISKSEEAFNRIEPIRQSIANYDEAIRLIDEGANTGVIQSRLPSFKQASQELDNLQGRLGLDVIGNTTFGALSEAGQAS